MENLPTNYFHCCYFTSNFPSRCFTELLLLTACKISQHGNWSPFGIQKNICHIKINKSYLRKLKPLIDSRRPKLLMVFRHNFYEQLFHIFQTSKISKFHRVSLANLCALLINNSEKII